MTNRFQRASVAVLAGAVLTALTGCGAQRIDAARPAGAGSSAPLYTQLPDSVKAAGVLKLGTDATAEPFAIVGPDGRTITGVNADLAKAIEPVIGIPVDIENIAFDQSVPSVKSNRVDAYWDWSTDTPVKRGQVDLVDFATTGTGLLVKKGNPQKITTVDDLCGRTVAVQDGSNYVDNMKQISAQKCVATGRAPIQVLTFDSVPAALLQIGEGRAAAVATAYAVAAYRGKQSPDYDLAGPVINPARAGIVVSKDRNDMRDVLKAAVQHVMDSGEYARILDKWGLRGAAIPAVTINDGQ